MFLLHLVLKSVLYNLHSPNFKTGEFFITFGNTHNKNQLFESKPKVRYELTIEHNDHPQSLKISVICFGGFTFDLFLAYHQWLTYLSNQMKIKGSDVNMKTWTNKRCGSCKKRLDWKHGITIFSPPYTLQ